MLEVKKDVMMSTFIFLVGVTSCLYGCADDDDVENFGMGCQEANEETIKRTPPFTAIFFCHCDSGDECNKAPCTEEGIKEVRYP